MQLAERAPTPDLIPDGIMFASSAAPGESVKRVIWVLPPLNPEVDLASYTAKEIRQRLRLIVSAKEYLRHLEEREKLTSAGGPSSTSPQDDDISPEEFVFSSSLPCNKPSSRYVFSEAGINCTGRSRRRDRRRRRRTTARILQRCCYVRLR